MTKTGHKTIWGGPPLPRKPSPKSPEGFEGARRMKHARYHHPQTDSRGRFWANLDRESGTSGPIVAHHPSGSRTFDLGADDGMD